VKTTLVVPSPSISPLNELENCGTTPIAPLDTSRLSAHHLSEHDITHGPPLESIVVRIEIQDTGVGIQ
jgi:hypothetical protein